MDPKRLNISNSPSSIFPVLVMIPHQTLRFTAFSLICGALFTACGSQIDTLDDPVIRSTSSAPAGIYQGTLTFGSRSTETPVTVIISGGSNARMIAYDATGDLIATGLYEAGERSVSWNARLFELTGEGETAEQSVTTLSAQGTFDVDAQIQLGFDTSNDDFGTVSGIYDNFLYEQRSDLPLLEGTWLNQDPFGATEASFTINQGGQLFGQDIEGCSYSGNFSLIEQRYNLYGVDLSISCAGETAITLGLATLIETVDGSNDTLEIITSSASLARLLRIYRR